ncbi:MAG TPA: tetratricopeptide repeat protein [Flavobacteriales bacterium]|nr:tetratricopeptide repeat protein [Flavobacteriales bacterium]HRP80714.1 tetratricopeptide repeat protein [Flavobacteriales bacterium]
MRRPSARYLLPAAAVLLIASCSTNKDAFLNRTFHRLTSRDNGWFNANEKLKETVAAMQKAHVDDYDEVLPIFVNGTEEEARAMVPELEICIEKCATVIDRHSMEIGGKEKNAWIDDAWFVIARSNFYKRNYYDASRTFDHISRRYKGEDRQMESKLWLARSSIELEQYAKAQTTLDEIKNQKQLPKRFPADQLSAVQADLDIHRGKVDEAITSLEHAVSITKTKADRIRWTFILAQLYQLKGRQDKAIAAYAKVTRMGPPYELGFHAQVFQALALIHGNAKAIRQKLTRMLRDEKHKDHYDMILYALAELDLRDNLRGDAISHLKLSTRASTLDTRQKAKSFLKLADLYFDDKQYPSAQQYYDSTSTLLSEENPRYNEVLTRADVLGDLVVQLNIISREDSLQAFAKLDPAEREKRVRELIRERERQEAEQQQAAADAREVLAGTPLTPSKPGNAGSGGAWYFYNPTQIARGLSDFRKKWGNRPNDDDWRRADKSGTALVDIAEEEMEDLGTASASNGESEPEWKKPESYLKDIPTDSAMLDSSNARICQALYLSGMIYKEKLKDVDNAIESFQVLNERFDDCRYTPESYYQLYRIYLAKEQAGNFMDFGGSSSQHYAEIILERWPGSEFARLVRNPDQLQADEAARLAEDQAYQELYSQYKMGAFQGVIATCDGMLANEPDNHLLPKYGLLKAMAIGNLHLLGPFRDALTHVRDKWPGSDEAKAASALLAGLDQGSGSGTKTGETETGPAYTPAKGEHYVIIIVPDSAGPMTRITAAISDFNGRFFRNQGIEVRTSIWSPGSQVVLIRLFQTKEQAMTYYDLFKNNKGDLGGINDQGFPFFAISSGNYTPFYNAKDTAGYSSFFAGNYLKGK